ncbi:MAG TPA: hypothetical protein VN457_00680, partial [Chlamydiales bacterium]|nr:hypothetical protein [Chlamydiales bacterium]
AIGTHQHHPQPTPQVEEELQKLFDLVGGVPDEVKRIQEAAERKKIDADPDKDLSKEAMAQYIACVRSDEWGGFCELMALCNIFHFKAVVTLQNGKEAPRLIHTDAMDILRPRQPAEGTDIYLDFERGSHWNLADPTTIRRVEQPAPVAHPGNLPAPRGPSPTSST